MAKKATTAKKKTARKGKRERLTIVYRNAAGIDVGSKFHVVAVPPDRDPEPCRTFRSFTGDLHQMADWLQAVGITTVAMESTGVYWIRHSIFWRPVAWRCCSSTRGTCGMSPVARPMSVMPSGCCCRA